MLGHKDLTSKSLKNRKAHKLACFFFWYILRSCPLLPRLPSFTQQTEYSDLVVWVKIDQVAASSTIATTCAKCLGFSIQKFREPRSEIPSFAMPKVASNTTPKLASNPIWLLKRRPDDASSVQRRSSFTSTRSSQRWDDEINASATRKRNKAGDRSAKCKPNDSPRSTQSSLFNQR
jgi:hypothetical protein